MELIEIDVTNIPSIKRAKPELENKIESLDVTINNVGIAEKQPQNISSISMENLRNIFETNFFGALLAKGLRDSNFKLHSVAPGYTATDLNQFKGAQAAEQAAKSIVKYATLDHNSPTGKVFLQEEAS